MEFSNHAPRNLLEDTGVITKQDFIGTNITISTALVNSVFLGIKTEEFEGTRIRTRTKSCRNNARIDEKLLEDTRRHGNKGGGRWLTSGASQPHPSGRSAWTHLIASPSSRGSSLPNPSSYLHP